jgi:hypothetical protein
LLSKSSKKVDVGVRGDVADAENLPVVLYLIKTSQDWEKRLRTGVWSLKKSGRKLLLKSNRIKLNIAIIKESRIEDAMAFGCASQNEQADKDNYMMLEDL